VGSNDLKTYFSKFGTVARAKVLYNYETGFSKGIGFVYFDKDVNVEQLHTANHSLHGKKSTSYLGDSREGKEA